MKKTKGVNIGADAPFPAITFAIGQFFHQAHPQLAWPLTGRQVTRLLSDNRKRAAVGVRSVHSNA